MLHKSGMKVRFLAAALLAALVLGGSGCIWLLAGAAAGAGTVAYVNGELIKTYGEPYPKVWKAASDAINGLNFTVESDKHDMMIGEIRAKRSDGTAVVVKAERKADNQTELRVRVGVMSRESSQIVLDEIDNRLRR